MAKEDNKDLLKSLEAFPPESREIAVWLRDWVWGLYPNCNELICDNYNFLAFGWVPDNKTAIRFARSRADTAEFMTKQLIDGADLRQTPGVSY